MSFGTGGRSGGRANGGWRFRTGKEYVAYPAAHCWICPSHGVEVAPNLVLRPVKGKGTTMSQIQSSGEAPAASLVGSLGVFSLSDVLSLLADTTQTGELQVVGSGVDGRVWLGDGELSNAHVGSATTIGQAVFELACVAEGWFYFTAGLVSSSGQPRVPVQAVLDEVRPQVEEWREIRAVVPLDSVVSLSPTPPGDDVQIRGDQWQVLTTVGTGGQTVKTVLDTIGGDQITGLRTLRDLHQSGLILLEGTAAPELHDDSPAPFSAGGSDGAVSVDADEVGGSDTPRTGEVPIVPPLHGEASAVGYQDDPANSLAEVAVMPPPIAADPWSPAPESDGSENNGVA